MALTPIVELDPNTASKVSQALTDIVTKLDQIQAYGIIDVSIKLPIPELKATEQALQSQMENIKKVKNVWKGYGEDLEKIAKHYDYLNKQLENNTKRLRDATKNQQLLNEELEALKKIQDNARSGAKQDEEADLRRSKRIKQITEEINENEKAIKDLIETTEQYQKALKATSQEELAQIALKQRLKEKSIELADKGFGYLTKQGLSIVTSGIRVLEKTMGQAFEFFERYTRAFGSLAQQVGGATISLGKMNSAATQLYNGIGKTLGLSIGESAQMIGTFNATVGILDKSLGDNQVKLIEHGKALGLDAAQVGESARMYLMMNEGAGMLHDMYNLLEKDSKRLAVSSAALSKNLMVSGKALLALTGPAMQKNMAESINMLFKMGVAATTVKKFTDLTDSFDKTAEAMAGLNTMFGTHINALEVFAEQDPLKRWKMISGAIREQGINLNNLSRTEKQIIAQRIGLTEDEVNALITGGEKGLKSQQKAAQDWASTMGNLKSTVVAFAQLFDKIMLSVLKAFNPIFKAFNLDFPSNLQGAGQGMQSFGVLVESIANKITGIFNTIAANVPFQQMLAGMGKDLDGLVARLMRWLGSSDFPNAIMALVEGFRNIPRQINEAFDQIVGSGGILTRLANGIKFVVENIKLWFEAWALIKAINIFYMLDGVRQGYAAIGGQQAITNSLTAQSAAAMNNAAAAINTASNSMNVLVSNLSNISTAASNSANSINRTQQAVTGLYTATGKFVPFAEQEKSILTGVGNSAELAAGAKQHMASAESTLAGQTNIATVALNAERAAMSSVGTAATTTAPAVAQVGMAAEASAGKVGMLSKLMNSLAGNGPGGLAKFVGSMGSSMALLGQIGTVVMASKLAWDVGTGIGNIISKAFGGADADAYGGLWNQTKMMFGLDTDYLKEKREVAAREAAQKKQEEEDRKKWAGGGGAGGFIEPPKLVRKTRIDERTGLEYDIDLETGKETGFSRRAPKQAKTAPQPATIPAEFTEAQRQEEKRRVEVQTKGINIQKTATQEAVSTNRDEQRFLQSSIDFRKQFEKRIVAGESGIPGLASYEQQIDALAKDWRMKWSPPQNIKLPTGAKWDRQGLGYPWILDIRGMTDQSLAAWPKETLQQLANLGIPLDNIWNGASAAMGINAVKGGPPKQPAPAPSATPVPSEKKAETVNTTPSSTPPTGGGGQSAAPASQQPATPAAPVQPNYPPINLSVYVDGVLSNNSLIEVMRNGSTNHVTRIS